MPKPHVAPAFALALLLSGCLAPTLPEMDKQLRLGDQFSYSFLVLNDDGRTFRGSFHYRLESMEGEKIGATYQTLYQSENAPSTKGLSLDGHSLFLKSRSGLAHANGVKHENHVSLPTPATATDVLFDFALFPARSTLEVLLGAKSNHKITYGDGFRQIEVQVDRENDSISIKGEAYYPGPDLATTWTANYGDSASVPSHYVINVQESAYMVGGYQLAQKFSVMADRSSYSSSQGPILIQNLALNDYPQGGQVKGPWQSILSQSPPLPFTLADAKKQAEELNWFRAFVESSNATFPAYVQYREMVSEAHAQLAEWNITFCSDSGACASAVVGKETQKNGTVLLYDRSWGGNSDSGGFFAGSTFGKALQDLLAEAPLAGSVALNQHLLDNQLPVRHLEIDFRALLSDRVEDITALDRLPLKISHGYIKRIPHDNEHWETQTRTAVSFYQLSTGSPLSTMMPADDLPPEWIRRYGQP